MKSKSVHNISENYIYVDPKETLFTTYKFIYFLAHPCNVHVTRAHKEINNRE